MAKHDKQAAARILYMEGYTFERISTLLSVSQTSITKWVTEGGWKDKKLNKNMFEQTSVEVVQELIQYQLSVLQQRKDQWLRDYTDDTPQPEESAPPVKNRGGRPRQNPTPQPLPLIDRGDVDALTKLYSTIRRKELTWDQVVRQVRRLIEFVEDRSPELAKQLVEITDEYLRELHKTMNE